MHLSDVCSKTDKLLTKNNLTYTCIRNKILFIQCVMSLFWTEYFHVCLSLLPDVFEFTAWCELRSSTPPFSLYYLDPVHVCVVSRCHARVGVILV